MITSPCGEAASAITLKAQTFAEQLLTGRHYVGTDRAYDPRFLLFEFTHNILLRQTQVVTEQPGQGTGIKRDRLGLCAPGGSWPGGLFPRLFPRYLFGSQTI